jgi:hypothetical protein
MKHTKTMCGQNVEFKYVKADGTGLSRVKAYGK